MTHLAFNIKRYLKIWMIGVHNGIMRRMAYRVNFFLMCIAVFLQVSLSLIFIKIIFGFVNNISGWSFNEALLVVASCMIIEGLMWATCSYISGLSHNVHSGTLDGMMVKPIDTQFLVSVWRGDPEDWARVIAAVGVFVYVIKEFTMTASQLLLNSFWYLFFIINAYIIMYSVTMVVRTLSFWVVMDRSLWSITENITKMSRYPADIYFHKITRIIFSSLIPLAFIATVPAKIFIHGFRWDFMFGSVILTIIFFTISRKFWLYGLKHYSSASS